MLIPTFSGVIEKANNAKDFSYVTNMNEILELEEITNEKNETMYDAAEDLEKYGMDIEKLPSSKGYIYVWNSKENRVAVLDKDYKLVFPQGEEINDSNKENYFAVAKTEEEINNLYSLGYSVYLKESATVTTVNATQGFDAGNNTTAISVSYTNSGTQAKDVVIRTNGGTLTIDATSDTVYHYGYADSVDIQAVKTTSYHENGRVPFMSMQYGRVVLESNSNVTHIHFERKTESSFDDIIVSKANNVELPDFSRDPVTIGAQDILVVEVQSNNSSEFVWLEANGNGTIEDQRVLVSSSKTGAKTAVTAQTAEEHVKQIANTKVGDTVIEGGKTAEAVEAIKEQAVNEYYEKEFVPTGIPANAVAYSYDKDTKELSTFASLEEAYNSVEEGGTGSFVICKDIDLGTQVFQIADKSITLTGQKGMKPVVRGDFYIHHTSGNHTVQFSNLVLVKGSTSQKDNIKDKSICLTADDANRLTVENCVFDSDSSSLNMNHSKHSSALSVYYASNNHTGTALVFKNNEIKAIYETAINTGCQDDTYPTNPAVGYHRPNVVQPIIEGNIIKGNSKTYGFVGSSAYLKNNTFDGIKKAFQVYAAWSGQSGYNGEFNFVVKGNKFKNLSNETFKVYNVDEVTGDDANDVLFDFADDNTFENVSTFCAIGDHSGKFGFELAMSLNGKSFVGFENPEVCFKLANAILSKKEELETDYMTLPNGEQVMTYTQPVAPQGGRTGLYYDVSGTRLWYFAAVSENNHYFVDSENNIYIVKFTAGGSLTTSGLAISSDDRIPETLVEGTFYKTNFEIHTFEGNTLYNATASRDGNKVIVTPTAGYTIADVNLFISNNNSKDKVLITANPSATADSDTTIYVVEGEGALGQFKSYGDWTVTIDRDVANYQSYGKQDITVNAGKTISNTLLIDSLAAVNSTVVNNGTIKNLYIYAKTTVTNNDSATINSINVGKFDGYTGDRIRTARDAQNSVIDNYGTIKSLSSSTKIQVTNKANANLGSLYLTSCDGSAVAYALDSVIVNDGTMCAGKGQNIYIYVRCTFTNNGIIGVEGRVKGDHANASAAVECEDIGGIIYLGNYAAGDSHNGLVFVNNGRIHTGARHNGEWHQEFTFWVCGSTSGHNVVVTIQNKGTINGESGSKYYKSTFGGDLIVNVSE